MMWDSITKEDRGQIPVCVSVDSGKGTHALRHTNKLILSECEVKNNNLMCFIHVLEVAHRLKSFLD